MLKMLCKKWWLYLLIAVLSFLIYRVGFHVPKPCFDPEKVKSVSVSKNKTEKEGPSANPTRRDRNEQIKKMKQDNAAKAVALK
jgi:hypothetical protein